MGLAVCAVHRVEAPEARCSNQGAGTTGVPACLGDQGTPDLDDCRMRGHCGKRVIPSVDDEELDAGRRVRAVRLGAIGNLVADAGSEGERPSILELGMELALEAQEDVALRTPVVRLSSPREQPQTDVLSSYSCRA